MKRNISGNTIKFYEEKESVKKEINLYKKKEAIWIVTKLDILSRIVSFLFQLKEILIEKNIEFVTLYITQWNALILGIFPTMAQHERKLIEERIQHCFKE